MPPLPSRRHLFAAAAILATLFSTTGCAHSGYERHDGPVYRDHGYRSSPQVEMSVIWPAVVAPPPRVYYAPPPVIYIDRGPARIHPHRHFRDHDHRHGGRHRYRD